MLMVTKQAIQSSANVIRITSVSAGDVYKRYDDNDDSNVYFGVVKAVHNDGEKTIIEATEYKKSYYGIEVRTKVIHGAKDYTIFPSSPDEFNFSLQSALDDQLKKIDEAKETIQKGLKLCEEIKGLISGETQKTLKAMSYKELTQVEYTKRLTELN
jgi:hypothetical protein